MKTIGLTEKQLDDLISELVDLTIKFKVDPGIRCIYFIPFASLGIDRYASIQITFVGNQLSGDLLKKIMEYNRIYESKESIQKFGFKLVINSDLTEKYLTSNSSTCGVRMKYLLNATILYDETKWFRECQVSLKNKDNSFQFSNLVKVNLLDRKKLS